MKNRFLFLVVLLATTVILVGCGNKNIIPANNQVEANKMVVCQDAQCLQARFLACQPAELKISFPPSMIYTITVVGVENGKCHWKNLVNNPADPSVLSRGSDCFYPLEAITNDSFGHLFGQDKVAGKEKILEQQEKLTHDYCQNL